MEHSPPGSSIHGIFQARVLSGLPFPSPGDLPDPGIEPRSPASQADTLPSEPPGKPGDQTGCGIWTNHINSNRRRGLNTWSGYVLYRCGNQTPACSPAIPHPLWQLPGFPPAIGVPSGICEVAARNCFGLEVVELLGSGDLTVVPVCLLKLGTPRPSPPRPGGSASLRAGGLS